MDDPAGFPSGTPAAVGRFRVLSRLGAEVLLGSDETGRRVALRMMPGAADPAAGERFRRDVQRAAAGPPWFAAPVLDADPDGNPPWVATAYVEGPSLRAYVADNGPLSDDGVFALAVRMLDGLVALHAGELAHRHLDPSTVLLAADGPRVIDTGLTGVPGAAAYRAPEERDPDGGGQAGDMYAFGVLLLFAATGRPPAPGPTEPDLGPLTGRVREGVAGCLQRHPSQRPTAAQLREYLRAAPGGAVSPAGPARPAVAEPFEDADPYGEAATRAVAIGGARPHDLGRSADRPGRRRLPLAAIAAAVVLAAGIAVGAVLLLGGTGGGDPGPAPVATGPAVGASAAPASTPATGGASTSSPDDPTAGAVVIDAAADPRFGADGARFVSPSRNITCAMTTGEVRCDVVERAWQVTDRPADCATDVTGAVLAGGTTARLACGPVAGAGTATLAYDTAVKLGGVVCVSRESGVQCQDTASGHGFRVSRGAYDLH